MSRQLKIIPVLDKEVAIYLAGLIDGEGCFYIARSKKQITSSNYVYCPSFKIVLTDEMTIAWIAKKLNRQYAHIIGNPGKNHQDTYCVRISDRQGIMDFIEQIIPYMITKKESAEVMFNFCKSRVNNWPKNNYLRKYNDFEVSLYDQLKKANKVGRRDIL